MNAKTDLTELLITHSFKVINVDTRSVKRKEKKKDYNSLKAQIMMMSCMFFNNKLFFILQCSQGYMVQFYKSKKKKKREKWARYKNNGRK